MRAVHTTGINWESIGLLISAIAASFIAAATYISSRIDRNREKMEGLITKTASDIIETVTDKHLDLYFHKRRRRRY